MTEGETTAPGAPAEGGNQSVSVPTGEDEDASSANQQVGQWPSGGAALGVAPQRDLFLWQPLTAAGVLIALGSALLVRSQRKS